jgi:hypothetical protein
MVINAKNFAQVVQIMNAKLMGIVWILVLIVLILISMVMLARLLVQQLIQLVTHVPEMEFVLLALLKNFGEINVKCIVIFAQGINAIIMEIV